MLCFPDGIAVLLSFGAEKQSRGVGGIPRGFGSAEEMKSAAETQIFAYFPLPVLSAIKSVSPRYFPSQGGKRTFFTWREVSLGWPRSSLSQITTDLVILTDIFYIGDDTSLGFFLFPLWLIYFHGNAGGGTTLLPAHENDLRGQNRL